MIDEIAWGSMTGCRRVVYADAWYRHLKLHLELLSPVQV